MNLLPCPFCGKKAKFEERTPGGTLSSGMEAEEYRVSCANPRCPVKPHTQWMPSEEYVIGRGYVSVEYAQLLMEKWNTRDK